MKIIVDKIASVTKNIRLNKELNIRKKIISQEGYVIVVEVLDDKKIYNKLELVSGRNSTLHKGDIIVVALGNRRALKGYVGEVPDKLKQNDVIHILNLGGVAGLCTSENMREVGPALKARVIGSVVDKKNEPINIYTYKLFTPSKKIRKAVPMIIVSGTCMNVGKTGIACEIIKIAKRKKYKVSAAKVAGIAALRDTANMMDYGATNAVTICDAGYTSSLTDTASSLEITKGAINYLSKDNPDLIVMELGDGVLGEYGVLDILMDKEFQEHITAHIGCANDPLGASKLFEICKQIGTPIHMISGPVTDNSVGKKFIKDYLNIVSINGLRSGHKIFPYIEKKFLKKM